MNVNYIRRLIRLVEESDIEGLEVSSWGRTVKITQRTSAGSNGHHGNPAVLESEVTSPPISASATTMRSEKPTKVAKKEPESSDRLLPITSPMVGTFYMAPSPDADPYISLNEKVASGQVVCIVEAMKLMNEIESEVSGRVAKLCVENAQPVEFGQVLFLIDPEG